MDRSTGVLRHLATTAATGVGIVKVTGASAKGGQVTITVFWRNPEEQKKGLPVHSYTVVASIFTS